MCPSKCSFVAVMTRDFTCCASIFGRVSLEDVHERGSGYCRGEMQVHPPPLTCGIADLRKRCDLRNFVGIPDHFAPPSFAHFPESPVSTGYHTL